MIDLWHKLTKFIDYERGKVIGVFVGVLIALAVLASCQPKAESLLTPGEKVTPSELAAEIDTVNKTFAARAIQIEAAQATLEADVTATTEAVEDRKADLEAQAERNKQAMDLLSGLALSAIEGTINPAAALGGVIQLTALSGLLGAGYDHLRKKNIIIANAKKNGTTTT